VSVSVSYGLIATPSVISSRQSARTRHQPVPILRGQD